MNDLLTFSELIANCGGKGGKKGPCPKGGSGATPKPGLKKVGGNAQKRAQHEAALEHSKSAHSASSDALNYKPKPGSGEKTSVWTTHHAKDIKADMDATRSATASGDPQAAHDAHSRLAKTHRYHQDAAHQDGTQGHSAAHASAADRHERAAAHWKELIPKPKKKA